MTVRELAIPGSWEVSHPLHSDDRGMLYEWFTQDEFSDFSGHRFDLRQANCSVSAAGVLRGLHFAQVPPGQAKFVTCVRGSVFDVVVDIRVGSPTYGGWDASVLNDRERRSVYISEGLAHGFVALEDDSTVMYLCSIPYTPEREHAILATDPVLGIEWPSVPGGLKMSDRDRDAPTMEQVLARGLLPTWDETRDYIAQLPPP